MSSYRTGFVFYFVLNIEENFVFKVSLFDYLNDLNHEGCIVRDERRDEIDKKNIQRETKLIKKNIKINISFPPKKVRTVFPNPPAHLKIQKNTFFHKKRKSSKKESI